MVLRGGGRGAIPGAIRGTSRVMLDSSRYFTIRSGGTVQEVGYPVGREDEPTEQQYC
jgi:hypothetical protein